MYLYLLCFIIVILAPTLTVIIQPDEVIALDRRPYNIFTLRCIANASENVMLPKSFIWRNGDNIINDNGNTVLTVYRPQTGNYAYSCEVSISVPGGHNISVSSTGRAIVKGNVLYS